MVEIGHPLFHWILFTILIVIKEIIYHKKIMKLISEKNIGSVKLFPSTRVAENLNSYIKVIEKKINYGSFVKVLNILLIVYSFILFIDLFIRLIKIVS